MHNHVFVAGTFDQLHKGHEATLLAAVNAGRNITIGLTSDAFVAKYKQSSDAQEHPAIAPFAARSTRLQQWLSEQGVEDRVKVIPIDDPYEPAVSSPEYDTLVVTVQNYTRGEEINQKRKDKGLPPLGLVTVPLISAEDGDVLSSTRIRQGEVTVEGALVLPESLRDALRRPLGDLIATNDNADLFPKNPHAIVCTVGDMTTLRARQAGILPKLSIIDLHVKRVPYVELSEFSFPETVHIVYVASGPGYITRMVEQQIHEWAKMCEPTVFVVDGEDDLLVLPLVTALPLGSLVYYGQPDEGVVRVLVTAETRSRCHDLLSKFEVKE